MEDIEQELDQKSIERVDEIPEPEPEPQAKQKPKKSKKVRSQAQIEAFERAKLKRAENIKARREKKEQDKLEKKATKTKIKERVTAEIEEDKSVPEDTPPVKQPAKPLQRLDSVRDHSTHSRGQVSRADVDNIVSSGNFREREQVIQNHYYYYGTPPPQAQKEEEEPPKRKKKSKRVKRPPTPSSSSESDYSDADEPESYQAQYKPKVIYDKEQIEPVPQQTKIPKFKFNFA